MKSVSEKVKKRLYRPDTTITIIILLILLCISMVVAVSIGPITIPFQQTIYIFLDKLQIKTSGTFAEQNAIVITEIRLPRVIVAGLVGCSLAVSGVTMQGLFRNPLVEPGFIGISSGA